MERSCLLRTECVLVEIRIIPKLFKKATQTLTNFILSWCNSTIFDFSQVPIPLHKENILVKTCTFCYNLTI